MATYITEGSRILLPTQYRPALYLIRPGNMITELPHSDDYKSLGKEWLLQSFDIVYDYSDELEYLKDWKESDWHFHKGKLATVLVLLHQAIESVLKAEIIKISPFLLIDLPANKWPTLPESSDKNFNELFAINSEALLRVFNATCRVGQDNKRLVEIFEEVRVKRNTIVHGLHKEILMPEYLINIQFAASVEFFKTDLWTLMKAEERRHPLYNDLENEDLITELYYRLKFINKHLSHKKYQEHIGIEGRGYLCPECARTSQDWELKSIYLFPNEPSSTNGKCIICDTKFDLIREPCWTEPCKGNVLIEDEVTDEKTCLTCLEEIVPN